MFFGSKIGKIKKILKRLRKINGILSQNNRKQKGHITFEGALAVFLS